MKTASLKNRSGYTNTDDIFFGQIGIFYMKILNNFVMVIHVVQNSELV